ncbi:glucuronoxylan 4-O-methyltransferase 1 [Cryptomeria japonica]|uniref:glucuronoxylan 4-O-methyltransferase 1 n=1 Tax=Cryptomeria japonica TaxID=3369 RepID=UPI0025AD8AFB|nr:glucuronoxylan 4-O-methyltransferase 1 [Cryptomeria japonica]XP_059066068.1 glucuronoxylan 4-O-methyltransferase 1 [Cryptomeria japonica]XP_059066069.1 glucuronoxylan 4-O-methyltransferase 1 [Cryptomeria japonica]
MGIKTKQMLKLRVLVVALFLGFALLLSLSITAYTKSKYKPLHPRIESQCCKNPSKLPLPVAKALVHYASSNITPQQTPAEIKITAKVLQNRGPCNMLVFGLGYDSLMWSALNHGGKTVFLEEDESWIGKMRSIHPELESHYVQYPTMVTEAYDLLKYAQSAPECAPWQGDLELSSCNKLALKNLPPHIYGTEWDLIMIDAPRGYFPEAPGRMQAIYSSAVMALNRQSSGNTDVFVHDVARTVEDIYSKAFLCQENLVAAEGKLWHFNIPAKAGAITFCSKQ